MRTVSTRTRVRFGETDAAGVVFYPTYFVWFDTGTHELLRVGGVSARAADGKPRWVLPIVECGATFVAPLHYDEDIEVVSHVDAVGDSSLRVAHTVQTLAGTVAARGFEQRVHVTLQDGRLRKAPIPAELRAHLEA